MPILTDESRYRIFRLIEKNPAISQREVARELGVSLGKANFCLRALIGKGILKASTFCNSRNKRAYIYVLTPSGIEERARITLRFLKKKKEEHEKLQREIVELMEQARQLNTDNARKHPWLKMVGSPESEKQSGCAGDPDPIENAIAKP